MLRELSGHEIAFIDLIADRLGGEACNMLRRDLASAQAEDLLEDGALVGFHLSGYQRPPYTGQHLYPFEGRMDDADGVPMHILLFADPADHLLELEYLRWGDGPLQNPKWETLEIFP